jgi:trimeric autotransporter adhesin
MGALQSNTTANDNNAMGANALHDNITGTLNNAMGNFAMEYNTTGNNNNAVGYGALLQNTTGSDNSAQGYEALGSNTSGNLNIAIGYKAGYSQTTGNQNIYIGSDAVDAESHVIRIGSSTGVSTQNATYIAGITGNVQTGGTVVVTSSGQLGVASSSRRYKQDIEPLGDVSERLYGLRPVKFRYIKPDEQGQHPVQFGLIAEEVAEVLPEVVYRNAEGKVEGVRYDELTPMLLNEMKQLHEQIAAQASQRTEISALKQQLAAQDAQLAELKALVATLTPQTQEERVAMR